jgi:cyclopropane fatty-acyl-phospholipid synthase-like methyltransferase
VVTRRFALRAGVMTTLLSLLARGVAPLQAQKPARKPDVFYAPTPQDVVDRMLAAVRAGSADVIYDLGSGDGRIPITAARVYGAHGVGIDIDPALVEEATANARKAGVADKVTFLVQDLFTTDIGPATIVSLYLTPFLNFKLLPKLNAELKPGTRVVSHQWEMKDPTDNYEYLPEQKLIVGNSYIYVWTIPILRKPA